MRESGCRTKRPAKENTQSPDRKGMTMFVKCCSTILLIFIGYAILTRNHNRIALRGMRKRDFINCVCSALLLAVFFGWMPVPLHHLDLGGQASAFVALHIFFLIPVISAFLLAPIIADHFSHAFLKQIDESLYVVGEIHDLKRPQREMDSLGHLVRNGHHQAALRVGKKLVQEGVINDHAFGLIQDYIQSQHTKFGLKLPASTSGHEHSHRDLMNLHLPQTLEAIERTIAEKRLGTANEAFEQLAAREPDNFEVHRRYV